MDKFDVVAAIIIKNDKYFIAQRNRNKHMGLSWEFPGGKVEIGETFEIALKRDTLQGALETVLDPSDVNTATKRFSVDHSTGSLLTGDQVEIETVDFIFSILAVS